MGTAEKIEVNAPAMGELNTANHLLGDRKALQEAWDRDGYWYFKGILDKDVIAEFKQYWLKILKNAGVVDADDQHGHYNGAPIDKTKLGMPEYGDMVYKLNEQNAQKYLTTHPKINATMKEILGDDPFWLPIAEYRATPPGVDPAQNRLVYPHQDGFYSPGIPMKICWIPIETIDDEVGGCAWVEGAHKGPILHDVNNPPRFEIPPSAVPLEGWRRSTYEPGDIVIFDLNTPHSGMTNISKDRFRLSMDIRVVEASGKVPSIGDILSLTPEQVTIRNDRGGAEETYILTTDTYCRTIDGKKQTPENIPNTFKLGEKVIINSDDGKTATVLRSIH